MIFYQYFTPNGAVKAHGLNKYYYPISKARHKEYDFFDNSRSGLSGAAVYLIVKYYRCIRYSAEWQILRKTIVFLIECNYCKLNN